MKYGKVGGYGSVPEKKANVGLIIFLLIFIIFLGVGGFFYYKLVYSKNSIQLMLEATYDYLEKFIESNDYDSLSGAFSMQVKFQSSDEEENEFFKIFNKLNFSGNYGVDYDKNILNLDFKSDYVDKDLIDFNVYTEYGRAYIYLDGLYDKYIDTSIDDYSKLFEKNLDDYKTIVVGTRKAMNASLKEEYFEVEKVTVDGEKLTKTTLDLTDEKFYEWNKNFTQSLLENQSYLESYAKLTDKSVDDVKKELNDELEEDKDYDGEKYIVYTKGRKFVKLELINPDSRGVIKDDNGEYKFALYNEGSEFSNGTLKFSLKNNESIMFFSYYDKEEELGMEINFNFSFEKNGKVERKDVTNSISSEKISEDDVALIYDKLEKNEGVVKIIEEIEKLLEQDSDNSSLPVVTG